VGHDAGVQTPGESHPDLPAEQAYVDYAYDCLERMRHLVEHAADAVDGEVAAAAVSRWAVRRLRTFEDAERGLCFGRLDFEGSKTPLYVGRRWVQAADQAPVVVNWQAPAARPFYTATAADAQRVSRRRRFRTRRRELLGITDETLDGTTSDGTGVADYLLEELERARDSRMRDIVATIQADQYRLIAHDLEPPLVIQGGPGTGKTAVALHRASWLVYTYRERLARTGVLVVGPNPLFMEYVSHVLPALGEESVVQRAVGQLLDDVEPTLDDPPELARLKGDRRLVEVVRRAAELRARGEARELELRLDGRLIRIKAYEVEQALADARRELGLARAARERFRTALVRRFYARYAELLGGLAVRDAEDVELALRRSGALKRVVDAAWPLGRAESVVRDVLGSRARLAAAAQGILEPEEQDRLLASRRRGRGWSVADVALLDEARSVVGDPPKRAGHVIVDEAQDLTPMQLRAVERRALPGSLTLLGDIAQGTGPFPWTSWREVLGELEAGESARVEELRHAYRVPREIMELALPLLDRIRADAEPPIAFRSGGESPRVVRVRSEADLFPEALRAASELAAGEGMTAVIAPVSLLDGPLADALSFPEDLALLTPRQAKGLEFDHVVVVEPSAIARQDQGWRELYVAVTRPTKTLVVVHHAPLPLPLAERTPAAAPR
jgi:DNA helicase IV